MLGMNVIGRLVRDTSIKFVGDNGTPVSEFTIAVDTGYGANKATAFIKCSLWGKKAESLDAYLKKGVLVQVIGTGSVETWLSKDGEAKSQIKVNVNDLNPFLDRKADSEVPAAPASKQGFRKPPPAPVTGADFIDDDVPF